MTATKLLFCLLAMRDFFSFSIYSKLAFYFEAAWRGEIKR